NKLHDYDNRHLYRTHHTHYYVHRDGQSNSIYGDVKLTLNKPCSERPDTYCHDPSNPIPTQGGQTLYRGIQTAGPKNQSQVEERDDMLVFTSEQLTEPVEVT